MDLYSVNVWLPGDIPLEWTHSLAWPKQLAYYDGYLDKQRGESLNDVRTEFCEEGIRGIKRL